LKDAFIIDSIRTPIGKFGGTLAPVRADDLAAIPLAELLKRNPSLDPADISDVILGCANQAGEDNRNVARMALLLAGLPQTVPGETVNRLCSSGLSSCVHAARGIQLGDGDVYIGGGMEHMTRGPFVISKTSKPFGRDAEFHDTSFGWRFVNKRMHAMYGTDGMGVTAENVAEKYDVNRQDQDAFAVRSQSKAAAARSNGRLAKEIVSVEIPRRKMEPLIFSEDEFIRPDTSIEGLSKLRAVFRTDGKGTVTAGNASGLNDGSCAVLLASEEGAKRNGLTPRARFVSSAVVGLEPRIMGMGPVEASRNALKKAGLSLKDIGVIELNEAFAAQSLACMRELGMEDDDPRVNPNGGAIAIGHPLGMSGARLLGSAVIELHEKNERYALVTMCVGVGQGMAAIIERV